MNIVPVLADTTTPDATVPAVADVRQEAQLTASYLMNSIDFSTYADTGVFYGVSRDLFLAIRSGYDCSNQLAAYLEFVKNNISEDGTLNRSEERRVGKECRSTESMLSVNLIKLSTHFQLMT